MHGHLFLLICIQMSEPGYSLACTTYLTRSTCSFSKMEKSVRSTAALAGRAQTVIASVSHEFAVMTSFTTVAQNLDRDTTFEADVAEFLDAYIEMSIGSWVFSAFINDLT